MRSGSRRAAVALAVAAAGLIAAGAGLWTGGSREADTVVHVGIVPARALATDAAERTQHGEGLDSGAQHVLVSVADLATGQHVAGANVVATVRDPRGGVQEKPLVPGSVGGIPDYSGLFDFDWSGPYRVRISVDAGRRTPVQSEFQVRHAVR
jgi:hypothetical protein